MRYWLDRLLAADPALDRLRTGARALVTAGVATALLLLLARWLGLDSNVALMGVIVPLMSTVTVQDASPAAQKKTFAALPVVAAPVVALGAFVRDWPWTSAACFVAIVFAGFEVRRFGARAAGLGNLAYQCFFYALLLQPQATDAGWIALFLVLGTVIAYLVRFHAFPERPQQALQREVRAWRCCVAALLCDLAARMAGSERAGRRVGAGVARLQGIGLAIDTRLARFAPRDAGGADARRRTLRDRLLAGELAAETLVAVANAIGPGGGDDAARFRAVLRALVRAMHGVPPAADAREDLARIAVPADLRQRFAEAWDDLCAIAARDTPLPALQQEHAAGAAPAPPRANPRSAAHRIPLDEPTRAALQASAAALAAAVVGRLVSPEHWYWAVFAAFIVFTRASSVGQTLSTAWQGVLANVAGVGLGLALADATQGSRALQLVLLFACIAPAFYAYRGWQPLYNLLLTAMLAMLYGVLGQQVPRLLATRLAETVAGALVAVACARLVFPARTPEHRDQQSAALLRAAARLLREALQPALPQSAPDAIRGLDRQLQSLRQTLGPVSAASYPAPKAPHRRRLRQLSVLTACVRHVVDEALRRPHAVAASARLQQAGRRLCEAMERIADALEGKPHAPLDPVPALERRDDDPDARLAWRSLARATGVVRALAAEPAAGE